ncbi:hypothetical protein Xekj_00631 [Xenorhabdus sp. KJ12.1]|nr:hypothetical protein Xekj_00631 [Xenorhabdus sp. KJ12.1]
MTKEIDKEISKHNLSAFGWKIGNFNHSTPFTSNFIYIRDFRYKHMQLFTVSQKDFNELKQEKHIPIYECVNFITQIMKKLSKKKNLNAMENKTIAPILVHYIKNSGCFAQWRSQSSFDERLHMVINIYYERKDNVARLRPFICRPDDLMLTAADFLEYTSNIKIKDEINHPEWFS